MPVSQAEKKPIHKDCSEGQWAELKASTLNCWILICYLCSGRTAVLQESSVNSISWPGLPLKVVGSKADIRMLL